MNENEDEIWAHPKGCVVYDSALAMLTKARDAQAGLAIKAAAEYFLYGVETELADDAANLILAALRMDADRSLERYRKSCEKNRRRKEKAAREQSGEIYVLPDGEEQ